MSANNKPIRLTLAIASVLAGAGPVCAQETTDQNTVENVVVTGTRVSGRVATETLSPVDVLSGDELGQQASFDLTDNLRTISPSFNTQRFPIADGTAFVRPANLRNLSPDQTLVLINGKRRHRSALVNLQVEPFGTVNQGAQAVDFSMIPANAVDHIEVLRDGAAAQYGSDAIAGVINVILKHETHGIDFTGQYGEYGKGDGENTRLGGSFGLPLGAGGYFDMSAEYVHSDITSRGSPRPDAAAVAAAVGSDLVPFDGFGQRWGDPETKGWKTFLNAEFAVSDAFSLYGFGSYADMENKSGFFYRAPVGVAGVTPRGTLFVDSVINATGIAGSDGIADPVPQSIIDDIVNAGLDPNNYVTADAINSPSGFIELNPIFTLFPGGYNPTFGADVKDYSAVIGVRGGTAGGLQWDASGRYGQDNIVYLLENSINPGLGVLSPLRFKPGDLTQEEFGFNLDFVYPISMSSLASPLNLAFGAEFRRESYEIKPGDVDSYTFGPTGIIFGVGSDGFQGDSPDAAGTFDSDSTAGYVDIEADITKQWTAGAAIRGEDFDLFGSTFDWKLSSRFQFTDAFAVRATVNTGFRAPTPGQVNTLDVTTTADSSGNLVPLGTFPVESPAAIALGATPVDPETSLNYTLGFVITPASNYSFTLDYYRIKIDDRIALATINITPGSPEQQALIDAGVPGATLLRTVSFFTNAVDATVSGIDFAATADFGLGGAGDLRVDLRHAYNKQEVDRVVSGTIDAERVFDLEHQLPKNRSILTLDWDPNQVFNTRLRVNYYSGWEDLTFGEHGSFGAKTLVDLEGNMRIGQNIRVAVGGENIFDEFPDAETNSVLSFLGATRPISSPFGFNGAFWYARVSADF